MTEQERKEFDGYLIKAYGTVTPNEYMQHEATWLAARRTQDAKVQARVKAVEKAISAWQSHNFDGTPEAVAVERAMNSCEDIIRQFQLKEQDDEASL